MYRIAAESAAQRAAVRAARRVRRVPSADRRGDGRRGHRVDPDEVIVTTGGQQVIDLVCKTLIDPGDVIVAEAPTYPGPCRPSALPGDVEQIEIDGDGMPIDPLEETLDRLQRRRPPAEVHLHGSELPEPRRRDDVAGPPEAAGRGRARARAAGARGQPLRPAALRGRPAAHAARRSTAAVYVIYLGTFSKILSPGIRLGWAVAPAPVLEKINLGKQAPTCARPRDADVRGRLLRRRAGWHGVHPSRCATSTASGATRCSRRWPSSSRPRPPWTQPGGGLFVWATLPDHIDTTDLLASALREENVAFVPGRAAYVDGRGGQLDAAELLRRRPTRSVEGVRRIGRSCDEQIELYGTFTGLSRRARRPVAPAEPAARRRRRAAPPHDRASAARRALGLMNARRVAVLKGGRSLERAGVAAIWRTRRGRAGAARARVVPHRRRRRSRSPTAARCGARRRVHRAARARRRGRHRPGAPRDRRLPLHRVGCPGLHALHGQGPRQAPAASTPAADPRLPRVHEVAFKDFGAADDADRDRGAPRFPACHQAGGTGLGAGHPVRASAADYRRADRGVQLRRRACCSSVTSAAGSWR